MSAELYACVHAGEFPVQALLRLRPELRAEPVAVLEGATPLEKVCSTNMRAKRAGAAPQMTRVEAEAIPGLCLLPRSLVSEAAARAVLLEYAANFSPRMEDASTGTACTAVLDIAGMGQLFGPPESIAPRIRSTLAAAGFRASVAISANFRTARILAASAHGVTIIRAGREAESLAELHVAALNLPQGVAETFAAWGIRTLGELAALDESDLVARLGQQARNWRDAALGISPHTFQPVAAKFDLAESCEFEEPVEQMESLLFVSTRMVDCLVERAAGRALSIALLKAQMKLEGGAVHECTIRPALPSVDRKFLLKLLQLEIAAHPPHCGVMALTLSAEAGESRKVQLGLFSPQTPEPSRLDVTIARLKAIVGEERVGAPVLEDTHQTNRFRLECFSVGGKSASSTAQTQSPRLALRRMRPPVPIRVMLCNMRPFTFHDPHTHYAIESAYGPWRSSGCWWSTGQWQIEEWDVLARDRNGVSIACLLSFDRTKSTWHLEALYD